MNYAINLLPPQLRPQTGIDIRRICGVAAAVTFLICALLYGYQSFREQELRRESAQVNQRMLELRPLELQIQQNKKLQGQIAARETILKQIGKEHSRYWSELLLQLGQATPENLWLTQVSSDTEGVIRIQGGTNDIDNVTQFINNLKRNPQFAKISFLGLAQSDTGDKSANPAQPLTGTGINLITYELSIEMKGAAAK